MIFTETKLPGAFIIKPELYQDERGFFARTWCQREFTQYGLDPNLVQCNISFNEKKGTLRGMHFQVSPHAEAKLVRCTMGAIYDVLIDLRPDSPTFKQWVAIELTSQNRTMVYIPAGFAHGFQTLVDQSEVFYQMSEFYAPESARGVRWNDSAFQIKWPLPNNPILSPKDYTYNDFDTSLY